MNKSGPIVVVEDDEDDREILLEVFKKLDYSNEIIFFEDGEEALKYLDTADILPFMILADINMPKMNGFELRDHIISNERVRMKCIPYLFFTTTTSKQGLLQAYKMSAQGFFIKPNTIADFEDTLRKIIEYWEKSVSPWDEI